VESIITTTVLMMLVLGTVDMGVGIFRMHLVSEAARQGARRAVVQGSVALSNLNGGPWGPISFSGAGNSSDPKVTSISPFLTGLDLTNTTINYTWPDNSNAAEKRVTCQVTTKWHPLIAWIFGSSVRTLTGESTMLIAH
jgi:hypothetical protein